MMDRSDSGGFLAGAFGNDEAEYSDDEFLLIDDDHDDEDVVPLESPSSCKASAEDSSALKHKEQDYHNEEPAMETMEPVRFDDDNTTMKKKSSMKKSSSYGCLTDEIPISMKRGCYKALPMPDMDMIARSKSMASFFHSEEDTAPGVKRNVSFSNISMRNYPLTLGDNPSVSYGPPTTLDWGFEEAGDLSLDDYENNRAPRRRPREMLLNYYQRKAILEKNGCSEEEIKQAKRQVERAKRQRNTTKSMIQFMKAEDVVQSVGRKAKRALQKSNSSGSLTG